MIRILTLLFILFFSAHAHAGMLIKKAAGTLTFCPSGTYEIGYDGDHDSGAEYFCIESGPTSEAGVETDSGTNVTVTSDYVAIAPSSNNNLIFNLTGKISADIDSEGTLFFSVFAVDDSSFGSSTILEISYDPSEFLYCKMDGVFTRIRCFHYGGIDSANVASGTKAVATAYRCGYTWSASTDYNAIKCVTSGAVTWGSPDDEDNETVAGFDSGGAVDPNTLSIGEDVSGATLNDTIRTYDVFLVPGYKATDPGSL